MANIQLADNLKRYRESLGLTQQALSDKINISRQAYSNYETGKRDPDLDLLIKICEVYSISLDELVRQPFSYKNTIHESPVSYHICYRQDSKDILYLTDEEINFVLEYRGAEREKKHLIAYVLEHVNHVHRSTE